jgi:hypothetical protein
LVSLCSGPCLLFYEATAPQQLAKDQLHTYQTVTQLFEPFARLVGPAAAGVLALVMSPERVVAVLAAGYFVALLLSVFWRTDSQRTQRSASSRWSVGRDLKNFMALASNAKLLALTVAMGFLTAYFGVFQSLLVPTMVGYYKLGWSLSAIPNIVGGLFSLLIAFFLPRLAGNLSIVHYGLMGAASLLASAILAASNAGPLMFSIGFGFLILASALYGIFFRAKRIELIAPSQLAQGIGATGSILMLFLPMSGLVTIGSNVMSPVLVIGVSGAVATAMLVMGMACIGALGFSASPSTRGTSVE